MYAINVTLLSPYAMLSTARMKINKKIDVNIGYILVIMIRNSAYIGHFM